MAVYTEVGDDQLAAFVDGYDIGDVLSFKGIAEGVENTNYLVHATSGSYILTLYEKRVSPTDLPFFLSLMEHLAAKSIACPTPVHARDGSMIGELVSRPAAIVGFLEGIWVRRPTVAHCRSLGTALARLHEAGADFTMQRANSLSLTSWAELVDATRDRADEIAPNLAEGIATELDVLTALWPAGLPQGVIHADLFPDNVFFIGDQLSGLIDFYFACNDAYAYDVAICLNAWCFEHDGAFNITKARQMLVGYESVRRLERSEYDALPILARGAALRFLLTRLHDWLNASQGAFVRPKDPREYLRKLRFHSGVRSAAEYGLDTRE